MKGTSVKKHIIFASFIFLISQVLAENSPTQSKRGFPFPFFENPLINESWKKPCPSWQKPSTALSEKKITIIIPSYNNAKWYRYNLESVFEQDYNNYQVIYLNDCSTDGTGELVDAYIKESNMTNKVTLIQNETRSGALGNIYKAIHMCNDDDIIVTIDGDDWLASKDVLSIINEAYHDPNVWLTYGQYCYLPAYNVGHCREIPAEVITKNAFRHYVWVTSHLRTFYAGLFKQIKHEDLLYKDKYFSMAWDVAFLMPMLEMSGGKFKFIPHVTYVYNTQNPLNDFRSDRVLQWALDNYIRHKPKYEAIDDFHVKRNE